MPALESTSAPSSASAACRRAPAGAQRAASPLARHAAPPPARLGRGRSFIVLAPLLGVPAGPTPASEWLPLGPAGSGRASSRLARPSPPGPAKDEARAMLALTSEASKQPANRASRV